MDKEERVKYWVDIAEYDFDTAKVMFKSGRRLYVAFMCHQAVEKMLKAYWSSQGKEAPYIHNLNRLAEGSGLLSELSEEQCDFIESLTPMNIEARYPEYRDQLLRTLTPKMCREIINNTKAFMQWIKNRLSI
ncbi:MAG: HEPN domain-containing protein [Bacteroidales bacterium]|nr:HEPN domain-containing protein [Bacteroidales bacterium]